MKGSLRTERTNYILGLASLVLIGIGIFLLYLANSWTWINNCPTRKALTLNLGALLVSSVVVALIWKLVANRSFMDEIFEKVQLAEEIRGAGILNVSHNYLQVVDWEQFLGSASKIDLFIVYGRTWRGAVATTLQALAQKSVTIRLFLPDTGDSDLMSALATRFEYDVNELKREIQNCKTDFDNYFSHNPRYKVFLHKNQPVYSCYRADGKMVLCLYRQLKARGQVPVFLLEEGRSIFKVIAEDLDSIEKAVNP